MVGRFFYGAGVGSVMAAIGLALASLVAGRELAPQIAQTTAPEAIERAVENPVQDPMAVPEPSPAVVADQPADPMADPMADTPEPAVETPAESSKTTPLADPEPAEVAAEATAKPAKPKPNFPPPAAPKAEAAEAPLPAADDGAKLADDVLAALAPKAAATDPVAPAALPPKPPVTTTPEVPASAGAADVSAPAALTEMAAPKVPDQPLQPPLPVQDSALAATDPPAAPKALPDDTLIANADPQPEAPQAPEIKDPSALPAVVDPLPETAPATDTAPAVDAAPAPESPAEAAPEVPAPETPTLVPLPDAEVARLPGTEAPAMPGTKGGTLPGSEVKDPATDDDAPLPPRVLADETPTLKPTPGLGLKTEGVIIGRLPKIGDTPAEADPSVTADRPLSIYARAFDNPEGKPLFAIILIDTGGPELDRQSLADLPFPVSFALDPLAPDTARNAAIYRAAGQEVVMLATGIAKGAQASDVEVAFQTMDQGLPEAVAVMDLPSLSFQDNRPLATLVVPVVAAQGRGLVTWDKGLNAADQVARRESLAAAVIFRNLDGAGEDKAAIRRALDRGAFKASQDGRVTVVGQTLPDTVAALLEWTVEGRAATVAIAPISAVVSIR